MKSLKKVSNYFIIVLSLLGYISDSIGQNTPVSQSANSLVDLITGDFKYSLPVMSVPGPNGEQVPISFHYSGGIRMDEQASWLGLGWDYNPGEISRHARGVSDDWNGQKITTISVNATTPFTTGQSGGGFTYQKIEDSYFYGPLYFKNDNNYNRIDSKMDVSTSFFGLPDGMGFSFPDYDTYNVSGPGIGGTMAPKVYAWGDLHVGDPKPYKYYGTNAFPSSKQVYFYFNEDVNQYGVGQFASHYYGANGTSAAPMQYNPATNRIITGTYVEHFTNSMLNSNLSGFLDYRITSGTKRPAAEFDPDGIGAFRITTPDGKTFHYSLPVYMLENEKVTSFVLDNAFNIDIAEDKKEINKTSRYAISWKLTAVTGVDFVDANNNGIVDIGDTGYWIAYNYGKWTNNYRWKAPFFNYNPNQYNKREPSNYRYPRYKLETYKNEGTVSTGQVQVYYLNSIQTATHSALFIKEVRIDAHAEKDASTNTITPLLRLSKIVLVRNENLPLFSNSASLPYDNRFSLTQCNPASVVPHIGNFNANTVPIQAGTLEAVEAGGDYSLCKMLYNNINNTFTTTSVSYAPAFSTEIYKQYAEGAPATTTDLPNSGKLTLKEIKIFGLNYKATAPSYLFDYDQNNSVKNPNFNPFRSDFWGYYKSDFDFNYRGRYTTEGTNLVPGSKSHVDAWSLKKITTPLNGEILIDYESDSYGKVHNGKAYVNPKRYFLIKSAIFSNISPWTVTVSKDIDDFIGLPNINFKELFIPYFTGLTGGTYVTCPAQTTGYNTYPVGISNAPALTLTPVNATATTRDIQLNALSGPSINTWNCTGTLNPVYNPKLAGWGYIGLRFSSVSGGGVRVKQITIKDPDNNIPYINEYSYENGAAGSEPIDIGTLIDAHTIGKNNFANDPNMPPAVVTYGKVSVKSKSLQNTYTGKTEYRFDNMRTENSMGHRKIEPEPPDTTSIVPCSHVILETFASVIQMVGSYGRPLSVTNFDENNNIVSAELYEYNQYLGDGLPSITETFTQHLREPGGNSFALCGGGAYDLLLDMDFEKIHCKNLLKKKTVFKDGVYITEEVLSRDPSTGAPTHFRITDPTAGITETKTEFAYSKSGYSNMGTKSKDPAAKNLLLAPYKVTVYRDKIVRDLSNNLAGSGSLQLIGGSKTTWQQSLPKRVFDMSANKYTVQTQVSSDWKPFKTYTYNGDVNDVNWREAEEITLFNKRNTAVESKGGVTNRYAAIKLGYDQQYVLCEANDARYADFTFSGFEDQELVAPGVTHFGGEVTQGSMRYAGDANVSPHTGNFLAKVDAGAFGPGYFTQQISAGRSYRASVWVHKNSPSNAVLVLNLEGSHSRTRARGDISIYKAIEKSNASNTIVGDWILMTQVIDVPDDYVPTGGTLNDFRAYLYNPGNSTAYFDDLAIRPLDISFTGNIRDEKNGRIMATLDVHNLATKYVYDNEGRISEIWIETVADGWKLKQRNAYNFKRPY